jgi:hypothetical protein
MNLILQKKNLIFRLAKKFFLLKQINEINNLNIDEKNLPTVIL